MSNNDKTSNVTGQRNPKFKSDSKTPGSLHKVKNKPTKRKLEPRNIIYSSMELTSSGDSNAKIIKLNLVVPSTKPGNLDFNREITLCNNNGVEISEEATAYHGITKDMLEEAPLAKDVLLPRYGFMAVWDGYIANILFDTNNVVIRKGSLIDLHKLLRFTKEHASHRITLKKAAIEATANSLSTEQVEGFLASPENKVLLLPVIFEYIRDIYKKQHGITDLTLLARLSRQLDKKHYLKALDRIKTQMEARRKSDQKKRNSMSRKNTRSSVKPYPKKSHLQTVEPIRAVA